MSADPSSPTRPGAAAGRSRSVPAVYFDGRSAQARDVRIVLDRRELIVFDRDGTTVDRRAIASIRVQEALRHAPQRIDLADGATLVVADKARLAALLANAGIGPGFVERVQRSWVSVGCAMIALAALLWSLHLWLLPWAASLAVRWLPASIEERVAAQAWPRIDEDLFAPSALPPALRERVRERFADVVARLPRAPEYLLEFRAWSGGANAYALPGGRIVVTDQMVLRAGAGAGAGADAGDSDALMGVLAHELGHVAGRHTLRTLIQGAAVSAVFSTFFGDASALAAAIPGALVTLEYSRDFERDADDYAVRALKAAKLPVEPMIALLRTFSDDDAAAPQRQRFLSAHPVGDERIARIRARAASPANDSPARRPG
ncbi:MAG: M48 family metallopeptidase [Burkholderiaceae bacterium]